MPTDSKNIGKRIKAIRDSKSLSQERFAKKIGISGKTISAYETGRSTPPLKVLEKIVDVYDVQLVSMREEKRSDLGSRLLFLQKELAEIGQLLAGNL